MDEDSSEVWAELGLVLAAQGQNEVCVYKCLFACVVCLCVCARARWV